MVINNENIDSGKGFDWGKTSEDYVNYQGELAWKNEGMPGSGSFII